MNDRTILRNAFELKKKNPFLIQVKELVKTELYKINSLIDDQFKFNKDRCVFKLPTNFSTICNIPNNQIQLAVYHQLIISLEERGYDVKIKLGKNENFLFISWEVNIDGINLQNMKKKLDSISI